MTLPVYDKCLLNIVSLREARGDGREAIRAVAHSIANRVKAWNQSWVRVITTPLQYSSMTYLGDSQTIWWPAETDIVSVYAMLSNVYDGTDPDNTNGALYYSREDELKPDSWYVKHIVDNPAHPVLVKIGTQIFRK